MHILLWGSYGHTLALVCDILSIPKTIWWHTLDIVEMIDNTER